MKRVFLKTVFIVTVVAALAACGGGGGGAAAPVPAGSDTTPPAVTATSPANAAAGVAVNAALTADFSETLDASTVTAASFVVKDAGNNTLAGAVVCSGSTATFTPSANFDYAATYTATITTAVQDPAGNALAADYTWTFTTGAAPASSGSLDTTFDQDGIVTTSFGADFNDEEILAVAIQPDGKIVAAGDAFGTTDGTFDFAVARYNADGSLDTTFNTTGTATAAFGANTNDKAYAVAIQADGRIVTAGYTYNGLNFDFAVVRYTGDGALDTTFNSTGKAQTAVGSAADLARGVAVQQDGKIIVVGRSFNGTNDDFAVVRYNADGSLDATFNGTGIAITTVGAGNDQAMAVAIQADGRIVVAGSAAMPNVDFAVVRYNMDGSLDTTFNGTGTVTTAFGVSYDYAYAVAIQPDGKIVVTGSASNGADNDFALVRYNADGSLDTAFNSTGMVITAVGSSDDTAQAVVIQADGKIVAVGGSWNGSNDDIVLVRYNSDGSLDTSFNNGSVITAFGAGDAYACAAAIQSDGKIIAAGYSWNGANDDFALVRYWP